MPEPKQHATQADPNNVKAHVQDTYPEDLAHRYGCGRHNLHGFDILTGAKTGDSYGATHELSHTAALSCLFAPSQC
uniref:Uncharacterized protein n=1 Tax=mine drainage metagenome TaxID=410659 RepID=E6PN56_9ZZZZ